MSAPFEGKAEPDKSDDSSRQTSEGRNDTGGGISSKNFFLELDGDGNLKTKIYDWFVKDGYIFDMLAAGVIILLNSVLALSAISPIER
jgi:hypothetical protein